MAKNNFDPLGFGLPGPGWLPLLEELERQEAEEAEANERVVRPPRTAANTFGGLGVTPAPKQSPRPKKGRGRSKPE